MPERFPAAIRQLLSLPQEKLGAYLVYVVGSIAAGIVTLWLGGFAFGLPISLLLGLQLVILQKLLLGESSMAQLREHLDRSILSPHVQILESEEHWYQAAIRLLADPAELISAHDVPCLCACSLITAKTYHLDDRRRHYLRRLAEVIAAPAGHPGAALHLILAPVNGDLANDELLRQEIEARFEALAAIHPGWNGSNIAMRCSPSLHMDLLIVGKTVLLNIRTIEGHLPTRRGIMIRHPLVAITFQRWFMEEFNYRSQPLDRDVAQRIGLDEKLAERISESGR